MLGIRGMKKRTIRALDDHIAAWLIKGLTLHERILGPRLAKGLLKKEELNILIIKLLGIGDMIIFLPALRALRETFPFATLTVMTTKACSEMIEGNPLLDKVIVYDVQGKQSGVKGFLGLIRFLRSLRFDVVIDLEQYYRITPILSYLTGAGIRVGFDTEGRNRAALFTHKVDYETTNLPEMENFLNAARALGAATDNLSTRMFIPQDAFLSAARILRESEVGPDKKYIVFAPAGNPRWKVKYWSAERFAELGARFEREFGVRVILIGSGVELDLLEEINGLMGGTGIVLAGKLNLKEMGALINGAFFYVGNETGPMHVAAGLGVPTVGIFSFTLYKKWSPIGPRVAVVRKDLSCNPCYIDSSTVPECPHYDCIRGITVDKVYDTALRLLLKSGTT